MNRLRSFALLTIIVVSFAVVTSCSGGHSGSTTSVVITPGSTAIDQGQSLNLTANVSVTWSLSSGPGMLTSVTSTSVTYNAPTPVTSSTTAMVTATPSGNSGAMASVTITITPPPVITFTSSLPNGTVGTPYPQTTITETGGAGTLSWSLNPPPGGLSISSSGVIMGTPAGPAGTFTFTVQLTDSGNPPQTTSTLPFTITISNPPPPVISPPSLPNGNVGTFYSQTITGTSGVKPYTFTLANGSGPLPTGLSLASSNNQGVISGTPIATGTFNFTVQLTDSSNPPQTPTQAYTVTINSPLPLAITTMSLIDGAANTPYSATVLAAGGIKPYTFSLATGSSPLPPNLTLTNSNNQGVITGTPTTQATTNNIIIQVADSETPRMTATMTLSITINAATTLGITTTSLPNGTVSVAYNATISAVGGKTPYTFSLATGSSPLPPNLTLSTSNNQGVITGMPTTAGTTSNIIIQVKDSESTPVTATMTYTLTINAAGANILKGQYAFQFSGFDLTGNPISYVGSFSADGMGHITGGMVDINDNGKITSSPLAGSYTFGSDLRGTITPTSKSAPVFAFAMDSTGTQGILIETDEMNAIGSGFFEKQDNTAFSLVAIAGDWAFGVFAGQSMSGSARTAAAGRYTLDATGAITSGSGEIDINDGGTVSAPAGLTGNYAAPDPALGRGTASLTPTGQMGATFVYYIVRSDKIFLMDTASGTLSGVLNGTARGQSPSPAAFDDTSLNGPIIFDITGVDGTGASVAIGAFAGNPLVLTISGEFDANDNGAITTQQVISGPYSVSSNGRGTMTFMDNKGSILIQFVLYLIEANKGFLLETSTTGNQVRFGDFQPQTGAVMGAPITATYFSGTSFGAIPAVPTGDAVVNATTTTATNSGSFSGFGDAAVTMGAATNQPVSGNYTLGDSFGRAVVNSNGPVFGNGLAVIYLISPSQFVLIGTTPMVTNSGVSLVSQQ